MTTTTKPQPLIIENDYAEIFRLLDTEFWATWARWFDKFGGALECSLQLNNPDKKALCEARIHDFFTLAERYDQLADDCFKDQPPGVSLNTYKSTYIDIQIMNDVNELAQMFGFDSVYSHSESNWDADGRQPDDEIYVDAWYQYASDFPEKVDWVHMLKNGWDDFKLRVTLDCGDVKHVFYINN